MTRKKIAPENAKVHCYVCGVRITRNNGYYYKNGYPTNSCKICHKLIIYRQRIKKLPIEEIKNRLKDYQNKARILQQIIQEKQKDAKP